MCYVFSVYMEHMTKILTVRLKESEYSKLEDMARESDRSVAYVARQIIREDLNNKA